MLAVHVVMSTWVKLPFEASRVGSELFRIIRSLDSIQELMRCPLGLGRDEPQEVWCPLTSAQIRYGEFKFRIILLSSSVRLLMVGPGGMYNDKIVSSREFKYILTAHISRGL